MTEKGWLRSGNSRPMLEFLWSAATDRQLRLFACACARRVWHLLPDDRSRAAVETAEQFADGATDTVRLTRACAAAWEAQRDTGARNPSDDRVARAMSIATDTARPRENFRLVPGIQESSAATSAAEGTAAVRGLAAHAAGKDANRARKAEERALASVMRDMFGSPFRAIRFRRAWRTDTVIAVARQMYDAHEFSAMPILADALQDAGCDNDNVLTHCRDLKQVHVRGCWVVDLVLGIE